MKPQTGELLGRVIKLVGGDNVIVKCTDGRVRTCRIRGKIKRRMWIRDHDLVLIAPGIFLIGYLNIYSIKNLLWPHKIKRDYKKI